MIISKSSLTLIPARFGIWLIAWTIAVVVPTLAYGQEEDDLLGPLADPATTTEQTSTQPDTAPQGGTAQEQSPDGALTPEQRQQQLAQAFNAGMEMMGEGKHGQAIRIFSAIIASESRAWQAYLQRGIAFGRLGMNQMALDSLSRAESIQKTAPIIFFERGKIYLTIDEFSNAIEDFQRAVELDPISSEYMTKFGAALVSFAREGAVLGSADFVNDYVRAVTTLNLAIEAIESQESPATPTEDPTTPTEDPTNDEGEETAESPPQQAPQEDPEVVQMRLAEAYYNLGLAKQALNDSEAALNDLQKASELQPNNTEYLRQLGLSYLQQGNSDAFIHRHDYDKITANFQQGIAALSSVLEVASDADEGAEPPAKQYDLQEEKRLRTEILLTRAFAQISLASYLPRDERSSKYEAAVADCDEAIELDPRQANGHHTRGIALRMMGNLRDAIDAFTEANRLSPLETAEAVFRRGIVWFHLGEFDMAMADFESVSTRDSRANLWKGIILSQRGEHEQAVSAYSEALRFTPNYVLAYSNRGLVYMQLGRYEEASEDFESLLRLNQENRVARQRRDMARQMLARYPDSR